VFLVVESTDGRTWSPGYQNDVIPLPNIRKLQKGGLEFRKHYANAPVCCPSRATFWSGRHASNLQHEHNGVSVPGAINNYEGLPQNFTNRIDQVLSRVGAYAVKVNGKTDWSTGGHTDNVRLAAWTMYTEYPYSVNQTGGWYTELPHWDCSSSGSVRKGGGRKNGSAHSGDWKTADTATEWIREHVKAAPEVPFFVYSGMDIVHPPYMTNGYWNATIDRTKVDVPAWVPLAELHPCDFQSSMLKGCTPSDVDAENFYSIDRRREVRAKYYAMIAEWDAMVGQYMETVKDIGVWNQTVFIVTSDHGDMQMEKQQFYKMVPYDASASVPMVIYDGRPGRQFSTPQVVTATTQLIDIFPTIMELTQLDKSRWPAGLDGQSLVPMMRPKPTLSEPDAHASRLEARAVGGRKPFVVSQFHGDDIAMSWFLVVQTVPNNSTYKLIVWGSGEQHPALLFDLIADPMENHNLIATKEGAAQYKGVVELLDGSLRSTVDYPKVALAVAQYGLDSLAAWTKTTPNWTQAIHDKKRWSVPWSANPNASLAAVEAFLKAPVKINPCRGNLSWLPSENP
jgi:arylsulfatase A-like enzyme